MKNISILGCGWLGLPLAQELIKDGHSIKGSTTSTDKIELLRGSGIDPFLITVSENEVSGNVQTFLKESEFLIIDIPPKLRGTNSENFTTKIKTFVKVLEQTDIKKVLFISSTSVYADDNSVVTENSTPIPDTESGRQLLEAENLLLSNPNFETTILRFGGLIGPHRHPVHHLAGRQNLQNPDGPVNLIHLTDCIAIIKRLIQQDIWNISLNAVAPFHPTRKEYYTQKAIELGLPLPQFTEAPSMGKTVNSAKLIQVLDYSFTCKI